MGVIKAPLHLIDLRSDTILGTVTVGLWPSLPVKGILMILGNDLAGDKVVGNLEASDAPCLKTQKEPSAHLYPSCAVTHAMAKVAEKVTLNLAKSKNQSINQSIN